MPLTRNDVTFDEIGGLEVTYKTTLTFDRTARNGHAQAGKAPVKVSADSTVAIAADGEEVHGQLLRVEPDGKAVVKVRGYATFPSSGAIAAGNDVLGAASNKIKAGAGAGRGVVIDASDTSAVVVFLG